MAKYEIDNSAEFVNPYNFVIAKFDRKPESKSDSTELRSGVLHCTLKTKTPLAILDTAEVEKDKNGHPSYPFLKVAGKACIPGSSIRGVIRSAYETVTKSCFVTFPDTDELLTTRTPVSEPYKPGILKKTKENGWVLYDAVRGKANVSVNINNHQRVIMSGQTYISTGDYVSCEWKENTKKNNKGRTITTYIANNISKSENETDYVMFIGETSDNKKYESVFKIDKLKIDSKTVENSLVRLKNTVKFYEDSKTNTKLGEGHTGYKNFKQAEEKGCIPIWYKYKDGILHFSMAAIGRMTFNHTVGELIGENGKPCKSRASLCPACELFGMAKEEKKGSKIRITDAISEDADFSSEYIALKELGAPRPGYYLFYSKDGKGYDSEGANIAGRKYYWHIPAVNQNADIYTENNSGNITERNQSCELVLPNASFQFDIYYDDITNEEYKRLVWMVSLGENDLESNRCYKIGHGKPLGLGSVKIVIDSISERVFNNSGYKIETSTPNIDSTLPVGVDSIIAEEFLRICDFSYLSEKTVCYPYVDASDYKAVGGKALKENVLANHVWFSENKKAARKSLPKIIDEAQTDKYYPTLKAYKIKVNNKNEKGGKALKCRKG